jgi:hypothetical protein
VGVKWVLAAAVCLAGCGSAPPLIAPGLPTAERLLTTPGWQEAGEGPGCEQRSQSSDAGPVLAMYVDRRLARLDVIEPGVETDAGIGVNDAVSAVLKAYGTAVVVTPHKYTYESGGQYLSVPGTEGTRLVFETDGTKVTRYRIGRMPEVEWVEGCA